MPQDLLRRSEGRFFRGNLHCHSAYCIALGGGGDRWRAAGCHIDEDGGT